MLGFKGRPIRVQTALLRCSNTCALVFYASLSPWRGSLLVVLGTNLACNSPSDTEAASNDAAFVNVAGQ